MCARRLYTYVERGAQSMRLPRGRAYAYRAQTAVALVWLLACAAPAPAAVGDTRRAERDAVAREQRLLREVWGLKPNGTRHIAPEESRSIPCPPVPAGRGGGRGGVHLRRWPPLPLPPPQYGRRPNTLPPPQCGLPARAHALRGGGDGEPAWIEDGHRGGESAPRGAASSGAAGSADFTVELQRLAQSPALSRGRLGRLSVKRLSQLFRLRCPDDACAQKPDKDALIET